MPEDVGPSCPPLNSKHVPRRAIVPLVAYNWHVPAAVNCPNWSAIFGFHLENNRINEEGERQMGGGGGIGIGAFRVQSKLAIPKTV